MKTQMFMLASALAIFAVSINCTNAAAMSKEQARTECEKMFPKDKTYRGGKRFQIMENCMSEKMKSK